ncbi:MAG: carbohydrate ABC transporter permease [Chloroflexota bacterium]|jgi:multiple sugar transport system permease protein
MSLLPRRLAGHQVAAATGGRRPRWATLALYGVLIGGALVMTLPFLFMVATALNPNTFVMPDPPTLFPEGATLANFERAITQAGFQRYVVNSAIVALGTLVLVFLVATPSAYAFARLEFPGRDAIFAFYLITMMVPDMIALLPKFQVMRDFGLTNSWVGLWVIYVSNSVAFNTFLLRGFFERLPRDLEDATQIDGGGRWTIFLRVLLPLSRPALAALGVFTFLGAWDDFWWARMLLQDDSLRTLPIGIQLFFNAHATQWSVVFAATTIAVLPEIVVFVLLQRFFVSGMYTGSVRG